MEHTAFFGAVATEDTDAILGVVTAWVGAEGVSATEGRLGGEIVWQRDDHYLFAHGATGEEYLLEGHTSRSLDETRAWLERLLHLCRERGLASSFEYVRVDEGREVSPEFSVR